MERSVAISQPPWGGWLARLRTSSPAMAAGHRWPLDAGADDQDSPAQTHAEALLEDRFRHRKRQRLYLLQLRCPGVRADLLERVRLDTELITGGQQLRSPGQ